MVCGQSDDVTTSTCTILVSLRTMVWDLDKCMYVTADTLAFDARHGAVTTLPAHV